MPGPIHDPGAGHGGDHLGLGVVPAYVNDAEFARNNRLFCDFIHRGIIPGGHSHGKGGREEIIAYL
jgi:hypothetical protein